MAYSKTKIHRTAVILLLSFCLPTQINSQSSSPDSPALFRYRLQLESKIIKPGFTPPNEDLPSLRKTFPSLFNLKSPGSYSELVEDFGVIQNGYESGGSLFFPLDRSPSQGQHDVELYKFRDGLANVNLPPGRVYALFFTAEAASQAVLEAIANGDDQRPRFWNLQGGQLRLTNEPSKSQFMPHSKSGPTCNVGDQSITFVNDRHAPIKISNQFIATQTRGLSMEPGITLGCRRVGAVDLIWLTADPQSGDGVTYELTGTSLKPLFGGHPFIVTDHFLVFYEYTGIEGYSPRRYLFLQTL